MLNVYHAHHGKLACVEHEAQLPLSENALWIDLLIPTVEEERLVEQLMGVNVPTENDMLEIEASTLVFG
jgi:magnesium transporter